MKSLVFVLILCLVIVSCNNTEEFSNQLSGPYLGQTPPDTTPEIFAPGIVSNGMFTRDMAITPDGKEIYYSVAIGNFAFATIAYVKEENGIWSEPEVVQHMTNPNVMNLEPAFSFDGNKLFFLSNRIDSTTGDSVIGDEDIWVMNRIENGWSSPYNLGEPINTNLAEFFPSITKDGHIYFSRAEPESRVHNIYRSKFLNGEYQEPERLPVEVNSGQTHFNAYVAQNENYIIVPTLGREDTFGGVDYYISFRKENDDWTKAINMGLGINAEVGAEWSPYVSPDGKYFFFMASRKAKKYEDIKLSYNKLEDLFHSPQNGNSDVYWVSIEVIDNLKAKAIK